MGASLCQVVRLDRYSLFVGTSIVSHWYRPYFACFLSFGQESSLILLVSLMHDTRWWAEGGGEILQRFILQCKPLLFNITNNIHNFYREWYPLNSRGVCG